MKHLGHEVTQRLLRQSPISLTQIVSRPHVQLERRRKMMVRVCRHLSILAIQHSNLFHSETVRPKFAKKTIIRARFPLKGYENTGMRVATLISNAEATYSQPLV